MWKLLVLLLTAGLIYTLYRTFVIPERIEEVHLPPDHPYGQSRLLTHVTPHNPLTVEKQLSSSATLRSYLLSYHSENLMLYALMVIPAGKPPVNGWPVIIVNHGHITPRLYSTPDSYRNTVNFYASHGFLVLKPDYRGHDQSQGSISAAISHQQYAVDVLNLLSGIPSLPSANPQRIFLYGHSMGADVSLLVAEVSPDIKGLSLWAPAVTTYPLNLTYFMSAKHPYETLTPNFSDTLDHLLDTYGAAQFSSSSHLGKLHAPIIIHHSPTDPVVPYVWGQQLAESLQASRLPVTFYSYPNDNHDLAKHWTQALNRDLDFFRSNSP
ncbi:alpha/beta hydrolase [Patescibacteria group bacterium]|nr:alpha/beta hydrolase [Patescibacteria group bacterium]